MSVTLDLESTNWVLLTQCVRSGGSTPFFEGTLQKEEVNLMEYPIKTILDNGLDNNVNRGLRVCSHYNSISFNRCNCIQMA